ncbi:glutamate receptor 2.8 [Eucalyptus grandis]|uniref:glutamate receptor 2.8 n=1 Tax=Eucalyptus grandis TaxID=71139 RepID=UPI00192ED14C|nr:glutamate receptor 2.8 [Eucalyptus grandis]
MGFVQSSLSKSTGHILSTLKLFVLLLPLFVLSYTGAATKAVDERNPFKVGVILDLDSLLGDQMRMAIEIACQDVNTISSSGSHYIKPHYINSHAKPLRAISAGLSARGSAHFLKEAKKMRLFYGDSIWIFAEKPFTNLLTSVEHPAIASTVKGAIGIITYHPKNQAYREFKAKFLNMFHHKYGENFKFEPGIDAIRAYDCIMTVKNAIDAMPSHDIMPKFLLNRISRTRLMGLSGAIRFEKGQLARRPKFQLVSVEGNEYRELKLWSPNFSFSRSFVPMQSSRRNTYRISDIVKTQEGQTSSEKVTLVIGVPGKTPFDKFVKEEMDDTTGRPKYIGFCIDVFEKAISHFPDGLKYEFFRHDGTYEELVNKVHDKTYDAAVGDITILANRSLFVEFTQPFIGSELSIIVPAKPDTDRALIFIEPFTLAMWIASGGILIYTMLVVWFLEYQINPEFRGPWTNQLSTALWFTFSSLFFAHTLILTQSYTAGLTSLLTLQNLKPTVTTVEWLRSSKERVGCDPDTFVCDYLINELNFSKEVIVHTRNTSSYEDEFRRGSISALFLEYPYERAFFTQYCSGYVATHENYRFGGFGFVFPKDSPLAADFSEAILELSQSGEMKTLENKWFSPECTMKNITSEKPRLGLNSFWALYVFTIATSTGCLLFACLCTRRNRQDHEQGSNSDNMSVTETSIL